MFATPVIGRELLIASRNPMLYRARALIGAAAIGYVGMAMLGQTAGRESGRELFAVLDRSITLMLLIVGPLMTADSISKERREGTLELLFLTSLSAPKIIGAKFVARLWQLLSLWLVMVPLMTVPILAGGLTTSVVIGSLLKQFSLILLSLGAGMLASVLVRRALPAMFLASGLAVPLLWFVTRLNTTDTGGVTTMAFSRNGMFLVQEPPAFWSLSQLLFSQGSRWDLTGLLAILLTMLLLRVAAQVIAQKREEKGHSEVQKWFREIFLTPQYWKEGFRSWLSRKMDKNPLIWLEYRRTGSRAARWMLVLAVVLVETYAVTILSSNAWFLRVQFQAAFLLLLMIAVTSASSFQREKENGAFELLLVAPFTEGSLLNGRLKAVWGYYLPPLLMLALPFWLAFTWFEVYEFTLIGSNSLQAARVISLACSAVTIPLAGLFYALKGKGLLRNLVGTIFFALLLPYFAFEYGDGALTLLFDPYLRGYSSIPDVARTLALHAALGAFFYVKSFRALQTRQFA